MQSLLAKVEQEQLVHSCMPPPGNVPLGRWGWQRKVAESVLQSFSTNGFSQGCESPGWLVYVLGGRC